MAHINVTAPASVTSQIVNEARCAAKWMADYIGIPEDYRIDIYLNTRRKRVSIARSFGDRCEIELATRPRAATLIDTIDISTLAHELIHARQYANGELRHRFDKDQKVWIITWLGDETYGLNKDYVEGRGAGRTAYRSLPWEREAYGREDAIARAYMNRNCNANKLRNLIAGETEAGACKVTAGQVTISLMQLLQAGLPATLCTEDAWFGNGYGRSLATQLNWSGTITFTRRSSVTLRRSRMP